MEDFYKKPDNQNKYIVLYFYPKDNSPGCTIQAKGFRDAQKEMISKGIYTIGVSMDTEEKHKDFSDSKKLNFQLISDTGGSLCQAYGAQNKGILSSFVPVNRITYIVGYNIIRGVAEIEHVFEKPSVFSDAKDCIKKIEELRIAKGIK